MDNVKIYKLPFFILDGNFELIDKNSSMDNIIDKLSLKKICDILVTFKDGSFREIITNLEIPIQFENVINIPGVEQFVVSKDSNIESFCFAIIKRDYNKDNLILSDRQYLEDVKEYIKINNNDKFRKVLNLILQIGKYKYKNWTEGKETKGTIFPKI